MLSLWFQNYSLFYIAAVAHISPAKLINAAWGNGSVHLKPTHRWQKRRLLVSSLLSPITRPDAL